MTTRYLLIILLCIAFVQTVKSACFSSLNSALAAIEEHGLKAALLRCEYRTDPLGIDASQPRLSWIVTSNGRGQKQTAYHVLVASDESALNHDQGDLWNSGQVKS